MPRPRKASTNALPKQMLIIDNGAYTMKAGFASALPDLSRDCHIIPNCLAKDRTNRVWVGRQLDSCKDFAEMTFRRPVQKGFLVHWEAEREIWDKTFFDKGALLECDPLETGLLLTEAPNCPTALQTNCDQIIFEEFEFAAYRRVTGASLNAYNDIASLFGDPQPIRSDAGAAPVECLLVIDSGYSQTTITPLYHGKPVQQAIRRLDIGGKFLTNYLKEIVSVRHFDVRDETHMMTYMKEDTCFVTSDIRGDLERTWKGNPVARGNAGIVVDYVLPDYTNRIRGEVRKHDEKAAGMLKKSGGSIVGPTGALEYVVTLGNERFLVPEVLFNPGDIGMFRQAGLAEAAMHSMSALPPGLWPSMLANILVVGGNANLVGFVDRLFEEIRQLAPPEMIVRIAKAPDCIKSTWLGGARLASNTKALKDVLVTKQEYQENGPAWLLKRFSGNETNV